MKKTSFSIRSVRLVLVYFIFILDYRNDIRQKKQIRAIFLFKVEMGCKAVETTHNINNAFDPGNTNEHTVQGWIKFCKGDESLEDEECSGQPLEADNDN